MASIYSAALPEDVTGGEITDANDLAEAIDTIQERHEAYERAVSYLASHHTTTADRRLALAQRDAFLRDAPAMVGTLLEALR